NTVADYFNEVLADTVVAYIQELTAELQRQGVGETPRLRILEIGAGTGGTSAMLFRKLRDYRGAIREYCYTDISRAFLLHAEKVFGQAPGATDGPERSAVSAQGEALGATVSAQGEALGATVSAQGEALPYLTYRLFNVEQPPAGQGID